MKKQKCEIKISKNRYFGTLPGVLNEVVFLINGV